MNKLVMVCMAIVSSSLLVAGCDRTDVADSSISGPLDLTGDEIGYYCNMIVATHQGPKGQIFVKGQEKPFWFASARDTIAFTMLPEEPKAISAIFVSDMGVANWASPEPGTWVDATKAWYVIGSGMTGGMGASEVVPFAQKIDAEEFLGRHGGRLVNYLDIPEDAILGFDESTMNHVEMATDTHSGHTTMPQQ